MSGKTEERDEASCLLTKEAFGDFFKRNYQTACLVSLKYISDTTQAEDLVQDVFIAIWEKRKSIQIKTGLKQYFFKAVKNHSINQLRQDKNNIIPLYDLLTELAIDESDECFNDEELAVNISNAIRDLPQACRSIFLLAYYDNLTYQQIADRLNLSKNTVKTQMGIAYRQLRYKLRKWGNVMLMSIF